jgi:CO/xanthine dehydrogenase FAD-binding subunit
VLDGVLNVEGVNGKRSIPLSSFFLGPGRTVLNAGDVVISITLPTPPAGMVGVYKKLGRNKISDLSIVGVAVMGYPNSKSPSGYTFRIALASVAPTPMEALKAEAILAEKPITPETLALAAETAMDAVTPIDDVRGSARYRKLMVRNLTREALTEVWAKLGK